MRVAVGGSETYAYTGARAFDAALPTVTFVHGAGNDHSVWALQSRYFAHHGRNVLAVDLPGHGRSAGHPPASVEALADWVAAFLAAAGAREAALVGHSMGALAALEWAWPGRVVHLWLATLVWFERQRTGLGIEGWETYASLAVPKGQGGRSWGGLRNAAITLRDFGLGELLRRPRWSLRYPRERLIAALPLLLHKPGAALPAVASRALVLPGGASWSESAETFLRLWRRYA